MTTDNNLLELRKKILEDEFSNLNKEQKAAVFSNEGPLLILAGAGSGKTTTIINKIGYLIRYGNAYNSVIIDSDSDNVEYLKKCLEDRSLRTGDRYFRLMSSEPVDPYNILAITFTNKAAGEMRERLERQYGINAERLWALTFHSLCVRILRRFCDRLGFERNFTIYDDTDSNKLLEQIIKRRNLADRFNAKKTARIISTAKCKNIPVEEIQDERIITEIAAEYQSELKKANAFDFDDLIFMTVRLLTSFPEVRNTVNRRFRYVLVDEYQDTNPLQYRLVSLLASEGRICVVGDDDQSIYRFMGASVENILNFEKDFANAKIVRLEQNYRSTQTILDAANAVIAHNEGRKGKNLWTVQGPGQKITVNQLYNQNEEGEYICNEITGCKAKYGFKNNDFCILYRTNAQSNVIENSLRVNGIPYRVFGGQPFFKRKEIQDILAYLNVICNPYDQTRLLRIINEPKRGIGDTTIERIISICSSTGLTMFDVLINSSDYPELQRSSEKLTEFAKMIIRLSEQSEKLAPSQLFSVLMNTIHYENELKKQYDSSDALSRIENVHELQNNIIEYEKTTEEPSLLAYLEQTALINAVDNLDENEPAVTLMTMHCAKGLEFNVVFIAGFEEGLFPSSMSVIEPGGIEEERRLCYVAITRAKKQLYITSVRSRMLYGSPFSAVPSRFLREIPDALITEVCSNRVEKPVEQYVRKSFDKPVIKTKGAVSPKTGNKPVKYQTGQRVRHKMFGDGIITGVTEMSSDSLLEVEFETVGKKKLMANYAKLTVM